MIEPFAPLYPWLRDTLDKIRIRCPSTDYRFPACPKCSKTMEPVRQVGGHLSREQFDSVKAGDWMCECHDNDRGRGSRGYYWEHELPPTTWIDLRHGPTRYAVLRVLADAGHSRPWALGAPWSPLTDEQAGRATVVIVRAVGPDPAHPVAAVPNRVLDEWERPSTACDGRTELLPADDGTIPAWPLFINREGWIIQGGQSQGNRDRDRFTVHASGPETGDAGRLAADNAARNLGCLMIEDLTP